MNPPVTFTLRSEQRSFSVYPTRSSRSTALRLFLECSHHTLLVLLLCPDFCFLPVRRLLNVTISSPWLILGALRSACSNSHSPQGLGWCCPFSYFQFLSCKLNDSQILECTQSFKTLIANSLPEEDSAISYRWLKSRDDKLGLMIKPFLTSPHPHKLCLVRVWVQCWRQCSSKIPVPFLPTCVILPAMQHSCTPHVFLLKMKVINFSPFERLWE